MCEQIGYESTNIIANEGNTIGMLFLYLVNVGLYFLIKLRFMGIGCCFKCKNRLETKLFFGILLDLIEASFIILTIAILIGIQYMSFKSPSSRF